MNEECIKLLQTTEQDDRDKNPIFPQTLGRAVYIDINGSTYDLQSAITQGLFYSNLINKMVSITEITQTIPIPSNMEITDEQQLLIFQNGILLNKDENYSFNADKTEINLLGNTYKTRIGDIFTFLYFPYIGIGQNNENNNEGITNSIVTTINSGSGNNQVPTAKAVYTFVTNYVNSLVNSTY